MCMVRMPSQEIHSKAQQARQCCNLILIASHPPLQNFNDKTARLDNILAIYTLIQNSYIPDINSVPIQHFHLVFLCKTFPLHEGSSDPVGVTGHTRFSPLLPREPRILEAECVLSIYYPLVVQQQGR